MKNHGVALEAAFDRGGIAESNRVSAFTIFDSALRSSHDVDVALGEALDHVSEDGNHYRTMMATFWEVQKRRDNTPLGKIADQFEKFKSKVGLSGATIIH